MQILDNIGAFPSSWDNIPKMREEMAHAAQQNLVRSNGHPSIARSFPVKMRDGHRDEILIVTPHTVPTGGSPLIVLVFGGGFVVGAKEDVLPYAQVFSQKFGATVACVTYRRAPEHKFPTAPHDVWDCFESVIENAHTLGASPSAGFIIGGISAGGNLAAVTARRAVEQGITPPLTGEWLCIPAVMDEKTVPAEYESVWLSRGENANAIILNADAMDYVRKYYQWDGTSVDWSPLAWPSPPKNVPRTFFQVCGQDPLRDDGLITNGSCTPLVSPPSSRSILEYHMDSTDLPQILHWRRSLKTT